MAWSDYGNGAGNCKSGPGATVWFQQLNTILVELSTAAYERLDMVGKASLFPTLTALTPAAASGKSRAQIRGWVGLLRSSIEEGLIFNPGGTPCFGFNERDDYGQWKVPSLEELLLAGSYGSVWVDPYDVTTGDAWNQIRECFDLLKHVRWPYIGTPLKRVFKSARNADRAVAWALLAPQPFDPNAFYTYAFRVDLIDNFYSFTYEWSEGPYPSAAFDYVGTPLSCEVFFRKDTSAYYVPGSVVVDLNGTDLMSLPNSPFGGSAIVLAADTPSLTLTCTATATQPFPLSYYYRTGFVWISGLVARVLTDVSALLTYG